MPDHSFSKEIFPNIQSKPLLMQLEAIKLIPLRMGGRTGDLGSALDVLKIRRKLRLQRGWLP